MDSLLELVMNIEKQSIHHNCILDSIKEKLLAFKLYLKTDFKQHIQTEDRCPNHCIKYSLSDPSDEKFVTACTNHNHDMQCSRCSLFPDAIKELRTIISLATDISAEDQVEYNRDIDTAESKIYDWKSHLFRSFNQDLCRIKMLQTLGDTKGLLIMDWAMKFLPLVHREKQSESFGQKGFNWHVTVIIYQEKGTTQLKHRTYVHTMESAKQDWFSVASVLEHTLKSIKEQIPGIQNVCIRSDNAGCYHCSNLWHALHDISARTGITITRYDFSEAQNGKSYCDSKIAHMRGKIRKYVAEGNNIKSAADMKVALDSCGGVQGCQVSHVKVNTSRQTTDQSSIKGINKISNIQLNKDGTFTCWKAYDVGGGVKIPRSNFTQGCTSLIINNTFVIPNICKTSSSETTCNNEESGTLFCPDLTCQTSFSSFSDLQDHCLIGNHTKIPSHDMIKLKWKDTCHQISCSEFKTRTYSLKSGFTDTRRGWALKRDRKSVRFSEKIHSYLRHIFESGEKDGQKANATNVARHMRTSRDGNGRKLFSPEEYLQPSQVASYFSRLAFQIKSKNLVKDSQIEEEDLESTIAFINTSETLQNFL